MDKYSESEKSLALHHIDFLPSSCILLILILDNILLNFDWQNYYLTILNIWWNRTYLVSKLLYILLGEIVKTIIYMSNVKIVVYMCVKIVH